MKKSESTAIFVSLAVVAGLSCGPLSRWWGREDCDIEPPQIRRVYTPDAHSVDLVFNEKVFVREGSWNIEPSLTLANWRGGKTLYFTFADKQIPRQEYRLSVEVEDAAGNSLDSKVSFVGFDEAAPKLLINEFNPAGRGKNPEIVEFFVQKGGNLEGLTFVVGTKEKGRHRFVFPSLAAKKGDYVLLHLQAEKGPGVIDEVTSKDEATADGASSDAWDFWFIRDKKPTSSCLPGKNGVLTLYLSEKGGLIDAVVYTNRTRRSGKGKRNGWSAALFRMVKSVAKEHGWRYEGEFFFPEEAVSSLGNTPSRAIARDSRSTDSDSKGDWHITPSGKNSFGRSNSDEVYSSSS